MRPPMRAADTYPGGQPTDEGRTRACRHDRQEGNVCKPEPAGQAPRGAMTRRSLTW